MISDTFDKAWKADRFLISEEHNKLILALKAFPEGRLAEKVKGSKNGLMPNYWQELWRITPTHIAQIQLMKRLYTSLEKAKKKLNDWIRNHIYSNQRFQI